ncbi:MAG: hypothetical protein CO129_02960 [Ignavibacteriales bacterium CG_4_9_14_3_um_filter_34_10]|nr:MAG: hypothetical protein CO129_02960 [Ignavibacteriales bacterium CG_4_9_14_3_um_filter_34_10]
MLKKNNTLLLLLFSTLLIFLFLLVYFGDKEKSFDEYVVNIDSTDINRIEIFPKLNSGKIISLKKSNAKWKVKLPSGEFVSVPFERIKTIFSQLLYLKPSRVIGRGKELFGKYQIDETATHIKFWRGNELLTDIYLGKFFFSQLRNISSCVRLADEDIIYEVENILSMQFDQNENYYRNNNIIVDDYSSWIKLVFIYPNDSSYQLTKREGKWFVDSIPLDSGKVQSYLMSIQRISSTDFFDSVSTETPKSTRKLLIIKQDNSKIELSLHQVNNFITIKSSFNKEEQFDALKSGLDKKIFVTKKHFLTD